MVLDKEAVKETLFETLKVRKKLIKLNQTLSFAVIAENSFERERYKEVLNGYKTLQDEYSDVVQKARRVNPQIEVDSRVSLMPIIDQIHSQNYKAPHENVILKAMEQLEVMTQNLMLDLDDQCQDSIERIISKRQ